MNDAQKWLRSFRYAYEGVKYALFTQHNMRFHFVASFGVLLAALLLSLPKLEVLFLLMAITLMIVTELINTAVEKTVDLAMPDRHPLAKIAKDVAAAAVLVSAVFAVAVGMIVFFDPIDRLLHHARESGNLVSAGMIWVLLALIMLSVIVLDTRFSRKSGGMRPSLLAAVAFGISTVITLHVAQTIVCLLSYALSFLILFVLYEKKRRSLSSLLLGAFIGSSITMFVYLIY